MMKKISLFLLALTALVSCNRKSFEWEAPVSGSRQSDSLILVSLYTATEGENWNDRKWDLSTPIDQWAGIKLNENGRVTSIDLFNNNLQGFIPDDLADLPLLSMLDLRYNLIEGCIPSSLKVSDLRINPQGNESHLPEYELTSCSGTTSSDSLILANLYEATQGAEWTDPWDLSTPFATWSGVTTNVQGRVTALDLRSRNLQGSLPDELGNLPYIESLQLEGNALDEEGCIPKSLRKIETLTFNPQGSGEGEYNLDFCDGSVEADKAILKILYDSTQGEGWTHTWDFSTELDDSWYGITLDAAGRVISIDLTENNLKGSIPKEISEIYYLQTLKLRYNLLDKDGCIPQQLYSLPISLQINPQGGGSTEESEYNLSKCSVE